MSTLRTTNLQNPSAASPNIVLGSSGSVAVAGALTGAGMDLINKTDFSAVSAVSINNCFTSAYQNYRILVNCTGSVDGWNYYRLRLAGTDNTANNYINQLMWADSTTVGAVRNTPTYAVMGGGTTVEANSYSFDIFNPALPVFTSSVGMTIYSTNTAYLKIESGRHTVSTAYDGITLFPNAGTMTGTVRVYGYRNA